MGVKRRLLGLAIMSFGVGVLFSCVCPCMGIFMGILLTIIGAIQLFC
ncbi:MAG: hypothetical protein LUC92_00250 [Clostridiales bacterium]|nr:hypothetical protein [Clostridiales bacterium]